MLDIDTRVKLNQIIESQLPEFLRSDFPLAEDFLKTYYLSQDAQANCSRPIYCGMHKQPEDLWENKFTLFQLLLF